MIEKHWYKVLHSEKGYFAEKIFLTLLSYPYEAVVSVRNFAYDRQWLGRLKTSIPVISVGNISVGGSGKTPLVHWCTKTLKELGMRPMIVSRGYGRLSEDKIKIVSNGKEILENVILTGDEPLLLAKKCEGVPVVVGADRYECIERSVKYLNINCAVLDDGFQHRKCDRNLDIVALERSLLETPSLFPRGVLRERISSLERADFIAIKNGDEKFIDDFKKCFAYKIRKPVGFFSYKPRIRNFENGEYCNLDFLLGKNIIPFCGLANPKSFEENLKQYHAKIVHSEFFPDHHFYSEKELKSLKEMASNLKALLVTTEKDAVKLSDGFPAFIFEIELHWNSGEEKLKEHLAESLK